MSPSLLLSGHATALPTVRLVCLPCPDRIVHCSSQRCFASLLQASHLHIHRETRFQITHHHLFTDHQAMPSPTHVSQGHLLRESGKAAMWGSGRKGTPLQQGDTSPPRQPPSCPVPVVGSEVEEEAQWWWCGKRCVCGQRQVAAKGMAGMQKGKGKRAKRQVAGEEAAR